jgi:choline dehydrogenase-like flavoprotein
VADPSHGNAILSALFMAKFIRSVRRRIPPGMGIRESEGIDENLRLWLRHLRNVALGAPSLAAFLPTFAYQRFLKQRKIPSLVLPDHGRDFRLHFHAEQTPNPASRVLLSDHRDPFGMPRIKLDFRVNEADTEGIVRAHVLFDGYLRKYGVGSVDCHDASFTDRVRCAFSPTNGHFIGTTRMAASEQQGVVDPDCRVFGQDNLFVASSSVFPTSSHANPTLTIVALAKRLADHLLEDDVLRPRSQISSCAPS